MKKGPPTPKRGRASLSFVPPGESDLGTLSWRWWVSRLEPAEPVSPSRAAGATPRQQDPRLYCKVHATVQQGLLFASKSLFKINL